jgi:hypothetical protein
MASYNYIVLHTAGVTIPNVPRKGGALIEKALNGLNKASEHAPNYHEQYKEFFIEDKMIIENIELNQFLCALEKNQIILRMEHAYKNTVDMNVNGEDVKAPALLDSAIEIEKFYRKLCNEEALKKYLEQILVKNIKR